nr:MAG TPA: hypothetical protein [Caudoviricetes sp.]
MCLIRPASSNLIYGFYVVLGINTRMVSLQESKMYLYLCFIKVI